MAEGVRRHFACLLRFPLVSVKNAAMKGVPMKVATVNPSNKVVDYKDGAFLVDGQTATKAQIKEYDQLGVLEWTNDELREYAMSSEAAAGVPDSFSESSGAVVTTNGDKTSNFKKYVVVGAAILVCFIGLVLLFNGSLFARTGRVIDVSDLSVISGEDSVIISDSKTGEQYWASTKLSVVTGDWVRYKPAHDDRASVIGAKIISVK